MSIPGFDSESDVTFDSSMNGNNVTLFAPTQINLQMEDPELKLLQVTTSADYVIRTKAIDVSVARASLRWYNKAGTIDEGNGLYLDRCSDGGLKSALITVLNKDISFVSYNSDYSTNKDYSTKWNEPTGAAHWDQHVLAQIAMQTMGNANVQYIKNDDAIAEDVSSALVASGFETNLGAGDCLAMFEQLGNYSNNTDGTGGTRFDSLAEITEGLDMNYDADASGNPFPLVDGDFLMLKVCIANDDGANDGTGDNTADIAPGTTSATGGALADGVPVRSTIPPKSWLVCVPLKDEGDGTASFPNNEGY